MPEFTEEELQKKIDDELKNIKGKLDTAYGERDRIAAELSGIKGEFDKIKAEFAEKEAERLKTEGKELESAQLKVKTLEESIAKLKDDHKIELEKKDAQLTELQTENTSLKRDQVVNAELAQYDLLSKKTTKAAAKEIISSLVEKDGKWQGPKGESLNDFVKAFAEDPDNAYLFKPVENSGTHIKHKKPNDGDLGDKKISEMTIEEITKQAQEGTLRKRR